MPDPMSIVRASVASAFLAALAVLLCGWPWHRPRAKWVSAGGAVGVGVGFFVAAWLLGLKPQFPPREDQDRLLLVLLPAVAGAECAAAMTRSFWLAWSLRLAVAAGTAPILLYGSSYVADLAGDGTREWSTGQTWLILGGLGGGLATAWWLLVGLARQGGGRTVPLALVLACAGAGVTVMLSGYASGGQLGVALGFGLAGAVLSSLVLAGTGHHEGVIGVAVIGLFAQLVIGRFFANLTTEHALMLFAAPLCAWFPELLPARWTKRRGHGFAQLALAAVPVALVLGLTVQKFGSNWSDSVSPSPMLGGSEPSIENYLRFGK